MDKDAASRQVTEINRRRYFRAGGVDQIILRDAGDIDALAGSDLKQWFALSMPTAGNDLDAGTLALLDTDSDGRIRPPELLAALAWTRDNLTGLDALFKKGDDLPLSSIAKDDLRETARSVTASAGKGGAEAVNLADVRAETERFAKQPFNGDGVVTPGCAGDAVVDGALADIVSATGGAADRSGAAGVDAACAEAFFAQAATCVAWLDEPSRNPAILPLGADTEAAAAALAAVRAKIDDHFARQSVMAYDPRAIATLGRPASDYAALGARDLSANMAELAGFPLSVFGGHELNLCRGVNPAWADAIAAFVSKVAWPVLGGNVEKLDVSGWEAVQAKLAPYSAWQAAMPASNAWKLGEGRLREIVADAPSLKNAVAALVARDAAMKPVSEALTRLNKLVLFRRDLLRALTNYVNFAEFYGRRKAVFIAGDLYMDARVCHLCMEVADAGAHAAVAGLAGMYLAYCEVRRPGAKKTIVAAFTSGDCDNIMVGRNGLFIDNRGLDWDASVTKIVPNPVSVREAFWSPYKKLQRFFDEMAAKRASTADAAVGDKMSVAAGTVATLDKQPAPTQPKKIDVGTVAALGVAASALGVMISAIATGLVRVSWWQVPLIVAAAILLISTPSMVMAWLKLRRRNLSPVLDACGWAVNTRARVGTKLASSMTECASVPVGARDRTADPYGEKPAKWPYYLVAAIMIVAAAWALDRAGFVHEWTYGVVGSAPKAEIPTPVPAQPSPPENVKP